MSETWSGTSNPVWVGSKRFLQVEAKHSRQKDFPFEVRQSRTPRGTRRRTGLSRLTIQQPSSKASASKQGAYRVASRQATDGVEEALEHVPARWTLHRGNSICAGRVSHLLSKSIQNLEAGGAAHRLIERRRRGDRCAARWRKQASREYDACLCAGGPHIQNSQEVIP
jgi:hypothetical protein